jgi:hypothetical protein
MEAGFELWFSIQWGVKEEFILMKQVGDSTAYCSGSKCFSSYQTRFSAIILGLYRYFISVFSYWFMLLITGKYNVQNPC